MRKHAAPAPVRRIQKVSAAQAGSKPAAEPWSKTASHRVAKRLPLGASLLEEMDESGFPAPIHTDRSSLLPEPPIERTATGGEPLSEWKPVILEHERPPGAYYVELQTAHRV